jgi:alcohol dehydrogenase (cytochrome c)
VISGIAGGDEGARGFLPAFDQATGNEVWRFWAVPAPVSRDRRRANRNGFFYVLDRVTGEYLSGTPYVKNITWASGLTTEGRPIVAPNMEPTREDRRVCPSLEGASNWYSAAFSPLTGLFYVQTSDKCEIFTRVDQTWEPGKSFMGGTYAAAPEPARRVLRASNVVGELPQLGYRRFGHRRPACEA